MTVSVISSIVSLSVNDFSFPEERLMNGSLEVPLKPDTSVHNQEQIFIIMSKNLYC